MPIDVNLLPESVEDWPGVWVVLQSSAVFATQLDLADRLGIPSFVPTIEVRELTGGRTRWVRRPLFPGYVCAKTAEDRACECRDARMVWGTVPVHPAQQSKLNRELANVQRMVENNPRLAIATNLLPGVKARITSGPLRGLEGTIVMHDGKGAFCLTIEMLGAALLEHIPWTMLERID